ncbi:MAG: hypothetical protein ACFB0C_08330 [Leptolyngbyaceae cyanobacterium]
MGQTPVNFAATDTSESVAPNLFQNRRFWLRLATYRPLLLVGGFWVVLLAIALVAYGRLTSSGAQSPPKPREPYPHEQVQLDQLPSQATQTAPSENSEDAEPELAAPTEPEPEAPSDPFIFPGWSLGLLVALCAGGCLALSQQLQAPARKRPQQKPAQPKVRPRVVASGTASGTGPGTPSGAASQTAPKRMQPYRPAPGATGFAPASRTERAATVTVVPEAQTHALDWPKDSLVNAMDMRQKHSVSSWLSS